MDLLEQGVLLGLVYLQLLVGLGCQHLRLARELFSLAFLDFILPLGHQQLFDVFVWQVLELVLEAVEVLVIEELEGSWDLLERLLILQLLDLHLECLDPDLVFLAQMTHVMRVLVDDQSGVRRHLRWPVGTRCTSLDVEAGRVLLESVCLKLSFAQLRLWWIRIKHILVAQNRRLRRCRLWESVVVTFEVPVEADLAGVGLEWFVGVLLGLLLVPLQIGVLLHPKILSFNFKWVWYHSLLNKKEK
jgi:hypothetical protein